MQGLNQLALASLLTILCCLLSLWRKDGIARELFIATARTVLQILLLGYALTWIFKHPSLLLVLLVSTFMTISSALHSRTRIKTKYKGIFLDNLFATTLTIWPLALVGSLLIGTDPWWKPELFLPLIGMLLGNVLNGISLGIDQFTHEVHTRKEEILSMLALGASTSEATDGFFRRCIRVALTPMLNAMASMGLVSIPGMMTGQILGGQDPGEAAVIQILFMIFISVGVYLGSMTGIRLARNKLFNPKGIPCF
ncbi:MAG TPA: ABC transporter permease [Bacteriovoracaceae bacterium]|nr:ABC transporter permease [Bacteriovoracaceae bacterium]